MAQSLASDWLICSLTKARLSAIDPIIELNIDSIDSGFKKLALHTLRMGGKKLRPSLYLLSVNTGDYYDKDLLYPAAAFELIHIASLYHDDVMDRAEMRRNTISVNAEWGNINATHSGNYLFSKAISILSTFSNNVNRITCHYVAELCLGQLKEAENAYNVHLTKEEHLDIIQKKTASLFELPCKIGATLAGANQETIEALVNYGKNMGIAFQLMDDILDLKGNPAKTGKKIGTDIKEGVYSYATLHALNNEVYKKELSDLLLMEVLEEEQMVQISTLIEQSGGLEIAKNKAMLYFQEAIQAIAVLPENATKQSLIHLANFIISRDH